MSDTANRILMISTYPPDRCGVALYAAQCVAGLRAEGCTVRVLTWGEGRGDLHLTQPPVGGVLERAGTLVAPGERVILQFMPQFYLPQDGRLAQVMARLSLRRLFQSLTDLEVVVHEQPWYPPLEQMSLAGRFLWRLERAMWEAAPLLSFHNQTALDAHCRRFGVTGGNARVISHGRYFTPNYAGTRGDARRELRLPENMAVYASVGFITRYKGYEVVLEALAEAPHARCQYHIVGTLHPRAGEDDRGYLDELRRQAAVDDRVVLHDVFVDDEAFDRWVRAADAVLLPYRSSTSSSVLARCHLLGTPAWVSDAAGLQAELGVADVALTSRDDWKRRLTDSSGVELPE